VAVLFLTYYVTKWIANYQKDTVSGKNIQVIETSKISATKYIQIIRIGERYVAIGVSKDQITNLGDVDLDDLILNEESGGPTSFKDIFEKIKGEKKK
jgi:flagellar protein FliO/FliZ